MCFNNIEIDFTGLKIACLTGPNGSGKSSLLDAISWAIWEKARSKNEKLVKLGRNNMKVELEFIIEGTKYKVSRYFRRGTRNKTSRQTKLVLDFYSYDNKLKAWQPLTESTVEQTQKKIADTIRLEYDTFVNSVYLRSSSADYFLGQSPEKRKSILAELLGLDQYEQMYKKAMEKAASYESEANTLSEEINKSEEKLFVLKKHKDEKEQLIKKIDHLQEKIKENLDLKKEFEKNRNSYEILEEKKNLYTRVKSKYEQDIQLAGSYLDSLRTTHDQFKDMLKLEYVIKQQYDHYQLLKERAKDLDQKEIDYHSYKDQLLEYGSKQIIKHFSAEHEYSKINDQLTERHHELKKYYDIQKNSEQIQKDYIEYKDLKNRFDNLAKLHLEKCEIDIKITKLQSAIQELETRYQTRTTELQKNIETIENNICHKAQIIEQINRLENEIKQYDKYEAELERIREKGISQREIVLDKANKNSFLELNLDKLKEKIRLLQEKNSGINLCPTCDNKILKPEDIIRKLEFEIDNLMIQVETNDNEIEIAEDEIKFYRIAYKEKKKYLNKRSQLLFELAELKTQYKYIELEEDRLKELQSQLKEIETKQYAENFAEQERYQISVLEERKNQIEDLIEDFDTLKERLELLKNSENRFADLQEASKKIQRLESELPYLTKSKRILEKELQTPAKERRGELAEDAYNKLITLNYDLQEHIKLRQQIANSQQLEYEYIQVRFAQQQLPALQKTIRKLEKNLDNYFIEIDRVNTLIHEVSEQLNNRPEYISELEEINTTYNEINKELNSTTTHLAVVNERIRQLDEFFEELKHKRKKLDELKTERSEYLQLAQIMSKQGLQDTIIENELTFIEKEANKFLAMLSDNRLTLAIQANKSDKTQMVNDRLDIYISDSEGSKSYELYSEGEAFRINFAIRLALAKLLARSRQVKLQSLIIDNAFSSQDSAGQQKLAETIKRIRSEFELILIVTHSEEFSQYFTGRIEVSKEAGSTKVEVVA
jgi:exonuclease SbcC